MPISGCKTNKNDNTIYRIKTRIMCKFSIFLNFVNINEVKTIKNGLIISDGCSENPNIYIHLLAPLFVEPNINTTIIKKINAPNNIHEIDIIFFSFNVETAIIIPSPKKENIKFSIIFGLALIACIPLLIIGYFIFAFAASYILGAMAICGAIVLGVIILGSLFKCNISDESLKTIEIIGFIIGLLICACLILNRC